MSTLKLKTTSGGSVSLTPEDTVSDVVVTVPAGASTLVSEANLASSGGSALVGYLPAGTGAVATTVQAKLRESVSVKDFGAVGDGITDDTAAINSALAGVTAGGRVYFPSGTYAVTGIVLPAYITHLEGEGWGNGLGTVITGTSAIVVDSGTNYANRFSSLRNFTVLASAGNTGIAVRNLGMVIENVSSTNGNTGLDISDSVTGVYRSIVAYGTAYGMRVRGTGGSVSNLNLFDSVQTSATSALAIGISVEGIYNAKFNTFLNCDAEQCTLGTGLVSRGYCNTFINFWQEVCATGINDADGSASIFIQCNTVNTSIFGNDAINIGSGGGIRAPDATIAVQAATYNQVFGLGQSTQTYTIGSGTGERDKGIEYTNTTGKAIWVNVVGTGSNTSCQIYAQLGGVGGLLRGAPPAAAGGQVSFSFPVPAGMKYSIGGTSGTLTVTNWFEVR